MIFAKNYARHCLKKKSWNIRHLVPGSFVPNLNFDGNGLVLN